MSVLRRPLPDQSSERITAALAAKHNPTPRVPQPTPVGALIDRAGRSASARHPGLLLWRAAAPGSGRSLGNGRNPNFRNHCQACIQAARLSQAVKISHRETPTYSAEGTALPTVADHSGGDDTTRRKKPRSDTRLPVPPRCRSQLALLVGEEAPWREETATDQTSTWTVGEPETTGAWRLTLARGSAASALQHERQVIDALSRRLPALHHKTLYGRRGKTEWRIRQFIPGLTTWEAMSPLRAGTADWPHAIRAAADLCRAIEQVHKIGWVHGRVTPHHAIHQPDGKVQLISWAWAQGPSLRLDSEDKGGLVHLLAPEHAARLSTRRALGGSLPLMTRSAEVYTLAASLWWAATGTWHRDYQRVGIDAGAHSPDQLCDMLPQVPIADGISKWPQLGFILYRVLDTDDGRRPNCGQLAKALTKLIPTTSPSAK